MSFSTGNLPRALLQGGLVNARGTMWLYTSSDSATDITATGYFRYCGRGTGPHVSPVGMQYGDVLLSIESSGSASPGRCTFHGVVGSTAMVSTAATLPSSAYGQGFAATVASHAST